MSHPFYWWVSYLSETPYGGFMWLYVLVRGYTNLSFPYASTSYQENPRGGYVSHTVVIRGYILQMYRKGVRNTK